MSLIIILIVILLYFIFFKKNESFTNLDSNNLNTIIINNINESNFRDISSTEIYNFFQNIYSSYNKYESALIIFNNIDIFNRMFILKKKELQNNITTINKILHNYQDYNIINTSSDNSIFWNGIIFDTHNLKNNIDNIINNTDTLKDNLSRRRIIMNNDNLRLLFKSIFDDIGAINFNS